MEDYCKFHKITPVTQLEVGMDFRLPQYRREVFLRFYEFHTKYKAHPGAVYYAFPYIFDLFNLSEEHKLWFCFINGCSQNVLTTWEIFSRFPDLKDLKDEAKFKNFEFFFRQNYQRFGWDIDRRYFKNSFEKSVQHYLGLLGDKSQKDYFSDICKDEDPYVNFDSLWKVIMNQFYLFGRLSTFSYMEYLRIAGLNIDCGNLFFEDINGSKSHRNGICKVLGLDHLDWTKDNDCSKQYTPYVCDWLKDEAAKLLEEARQRFQDTTYFTLESTLCCYKSWYRKNRRYPNVYNDMFWDRILVNEKAWGKINTMFRSIRRECLPRYLRVEYNDWDPGLKPVKQNWFRNTGQVIMMDLDWDCFKNDFKEHSLL